ncbi:hypothetical protein NKR19_g10086 [Coniochaeta hoffmannii]|uniref:Uncharacterized protein n=1 Tax=Coniochaeta hoffmannii TaxID=91930 RepID=A0AA38RGA4_9PEZI|nr:hypothetical protein NKR19_g10086 [Coniochaeta hoffmannii]
MVASLQGDPDVSPQENLNCLLAAPWADRSSPQTMRLLDRVDDLQMQAVQACRQFATPFELNAAIPRTRKGKEVHFTPIPSEEDRRRHVERQRLAKTLSGHQHPRVEDITDQEDADPPSSRLPSLRSGPAPPSSTPMPESSQAGEASFTLPHAEDDAARSPAMDDEDLEVTDVTEDASDATARLQREAEKMRNDLIETLVQREADKARAEFQRRGRGRVPTTSSAVPELREQDFAQMEKALEQLQKKYQAHARTQSHIRALGQYGLDPMDIGAILKQVDLSVGWWQLMDASPRMRTQLQRLLSAESHASRGRKRPDKQPAEPTEGIRNLIPVDDYDDEDLQEDTGMEPVYHDVALSLREIGGTSVGYVEGLVNGVHSARLMLDNGAGLDCISPDFVKRLDVQIHELAHPYPVSLANDVHDTVSRYVFVNVVIGGVLTVMAAFLYGSDKSYDILLSTAWYKRVRAIQDWGDNTLTVRGRGDFQRTVKFHPAPGKPSARVTPIAAVDGTSTPQGFDFDRHLEIRKLTTALEFAELVEFTLQPGKGQA